MANLEKEHPDITYLKQDDIGLVLSKALASTYQAQPNQPIDFFAKWLLNYRKTQKLASKVKRLFHSSQAPEEEKAVKEARDMKKRKENEATEIKEEQEQADKAKAAKEAAFWEKIEQSDDLNDNLQELVDHIKAFTQVESVYVGKLVQPKKDIAEDDDDAAHQDEESQKIIQFSHASAGQEFMVDQVLANEETKGITHDVFKEAEEAQEEAPAEEGEEGEEVEKPPKTEEEELLALKHVYVPEVVREPRMVFYKVPRLGSYLAVPLVYNSCLLESALDTAVTNFQDCKARREAQAKEKEEWEEANRKEEGAEPDPNEEEKVWEEINEDPFETFEEKFVVCVDTLGQDRQISKEEKLFILKTVRRYKEIWERVEKENLTKDRDDKLEQLEQDRDFIDNEATKATDEEDKYVDEQINAREDIGDDDAKELEAKKIRLTHMAQQLAENEKWRKLLLENLPKINVLKQGRILQSVFYMLGYERENICERMTNRIWWKIAKKHVTEEFLKKMVEYQVSGPKEGHFKKYQLLNFIEKNIASFNVEEVEQISVLQARLLKWLQLAVQTRKEDIVRRKALNRKRKEFREAQQQAHQEREEKQVKDLEEAIAAFEEEHKEEIEAFQKWEEEQNKVPGPGDDYGEEDEEEPDKDEEPKEAPVKPVFNQEEFTSKWVEENPPIEIPPEVVFDIDNDWELDEEEEDNLIRAWLEARQSD